MLKFISKLYTTILVCYSLNKWISSRFRDRFYAQYFTSLALLMSLESLFSFILYKIPFFNLVKIIFISILSHRGSSNHNYNNNYRVINTSVDENTDDKNLKSSFNQSTNLLPMKILKLYISNFYFMTSNSFNTITKEMIPYIINLIKNEQSLFDVFYKLKIELKLKLVSFLTDDVTSNRENFNKSIYHVIENENKLNIFSDNNVQIENKLNISSDDNNVQMENKLYISSDNNNNLKREKEAETEELKMYNYNKKTDEKDTIISEDNIMENAYFFRRFFF